MLALIAPITTYLLPLLALTVLLIGIVENRLNYLIATVWVSLIILINQYLKSGGEILGNYFDYKQAALYTLTLTVLITALLILSYRIKALKRLSYKLIAATVSALSVIGALILSINLWMNAYFISDKRQGTAIMQVVSFTPPEFCRSHSIFYKVSSHGDVIYLCPNHYGFIPSIGTLEVAPNFLLNQFQQRAQINLKHPTNHTKATLQS